MKQRNKSTLILNILLCTVSVVIIIYTVLVAGLKPCPMCLIQQACVILVLIISLVMLFIGRFTTINFILRIILIIVVCTGMYVAGDQTYLQYFATVPAIDSSTCSAVSNPFIINTTKALVGSVESCSEMNETISGLSMAVYSLLFFMLLLVINLAGIISIISKGSRDKC